jgi:anti-anti-sigma regulatory factor
MHADEAAARAVARAIVDTDVGAGLSPSGDLDVHVLPAETGARRSRAPSRNVDTERVTFIDSSALVALLGAARRRTSDGGEPVGRVSETTSTVEARRVEH